MDQDQMDSEELRPEDDWDLPQEARLPIMATPPKERAMEPQGHPGAGIAATPAREHAPATKSTPLVLPRASKLDHQPAFLTRGALFSSAKHAAALPPNSPVKSQGSYDLRASGARLGMRDKAVWEAAMQVAKESGDAGQDIPVHLSDLARRMGLRDANGAALAGIWGSLERLANAHVEVELQGQVHAGKMLESATKNGRARSIRVDLGWSTAILEQDYQFKLDAARRAKLSGSLAQWLHDFISTHDSYSRKLTIGYLRDLCGFEGQARRFPSLLNAALAELAAKAPELVAGHSVKKVGRSSCKWELAILRGPEAPAFCKPKARVAPRHGRSQHKGVAL